MSFEVTRDASSKELLEQCKALLSITADPVANAANLSAFLFQALEDVNWVGFYFYRDGQLVVGPFQGKPACVLIPMGRGVCGTAAATRQTQRVADVDAFDGHITCDVASRSEIVLPLIKHGELLGVLDLDSPRLDRFSPGDERFLEEITGLYLASIA